MGVFNNWPYTDVHQLNLDFILDAVKDYKEKAEELDSAVETATTAAENATDSKNAAANSANSARLYKEGAEQVYGDIVSYTNSMQQQINTNTENITINAAQIDTIISGSTPDANTELLNIRVGYNGHTYNTAGDAVRGQVSDLHQIITDNRIIKTVENEIIAINDAVALEPVELKIKIPYQSTAVGSVSIRYRGRNMLDLTGTVTSAGLTYTPQPDGTLKTNGTSTGNSRYGFYGSTAYINANNTFNLPAGTYTIFYYSVTNNNYSNILHVYKNTTTQKIADAVTTGPNVFTNPTSQIGRVASQLSSGFTVSNSITLPFMAVGECTLADWAPASLTRNQTDITLSTPIYGGEIDLINGIVYSVYEADGTEKVTPDTYSITTSIPTLLEGYNTIWASLPGSSIKMSYNILLKNYIDNQITDVNNEISTLNDTKLGCEDFYTSLSMYENIGIIGDSYAAGSIHIPVSGGEQYAGKYENLSWGKNIQRMNGNNVVLYAKSGLSTATWLNNTSYGLSKLLQNPACGLYWFALGINDVTLYNNDNSYLGTLHDITNHTPGTAWPATFYGNVGCIMENIMSSKPNSKIVISSFVGYRPKSPTDADIALNAALLDIAEYYSLPFIDLHNDPFYMSDFYTNNIVGKHPTAILYSGMAYANSRLYNSAVLNYTSYFNDYHLGSYTPDPDDPI